MNRKVVGEIRDYFEAYELMDKLIDNSKESSAIIVNIYHNDEKQVLNVQVIERITRGSKKAKRVYRSLGIDINDNMFCEFKLNYSKAKFTFKLNQEKLQFFNEQVKVNLQKKYRCNVLGTIVTVELVSPRLQEVMDIFSDFEPICRRIIKQ